MQKQSREKIRNGRNPAQTIFTRFMLIVAFFILWIGGIGVRLVHLQVNQHEWLRAQALDQRRNQVKSKQLRGSIYDRSERALAMSVQAKSLFADPAEITDVDATARRVAAALKVKPDEIFKDLTEAKEKGKRFVASGKHAEKSRSQSVLAVMRAFDNARHGVRSIWDEKEPVTLMELGLSDETALQFQDCEDSAFETLWAEVATHAQLSKLFNE